MTGRLIFCCAVSAVLSLPLFAVNSSFASGFLAGASAGVICFFVQNLCAKAAVKGNGSSPLYFLLMAMRILIAAALISAALRWGCHGAGALLGVTAALVTYVVSLLRAEPRKALLSEGR